MPQFNTWTPRTNAFVGKQLETYHHNPKARAWTQTAQIMGDLGYGAGGAIGLAASYGARRFGRWYYPSEKINVSTRSRGRYRPRSYTKTVTKKKKKRSGKVCCRYRRGKKYCSPEFCDKRRKIKYWY